MPFRPIRSDAATVYLDHSTLCEAFRAREGVAGAESSFVAVARWIESSAPKVNVCLSMIHVLELAAWPDRTFALEVGHWLESIEMVYVRSTAAVVGEEMRKALARASGNVTQPISPFASSLLHGLDQAPALSDLAGLLTGKPIIGFMNARDPIGAAETRRFAVPAATRFRNDRARAAADGLSDSLKSAILTANRERALREQISDLGQDVQRTPETVSEVVEAYRRDPFSLPAFHAANELMARFGEAAVGRSPGSQRDARLQSSIPDIDHATVGGVYCDVFSCDSETAGWLAPLRMGVGKPQPLTHRAFRNDGGAFAAALARATAR